MAWRILAYHGVPSDSARAFARQLDHFLGQGWQSVGLSEGLRSAQRGRGRFLTVTFDDGQASVCEVAQRVLDDRDIKGTLYLVTDYVARGQTYRDARPARACSWEQLRNWLEAGHEIGSHTHTHVPLPDCPHDWYAEELERSRDAVQKKLGYRPLHFAYPYGSHDRTTYARLKAFGDWASAATTERGMNGPRSDPLLLRRDLMEPRWSPAHVRLRLAVGACPLLFRALRSLRLVLAGYRRRPDATVF
jgi:peptidoglycan/xylan/chitin deacetylase (PgdA/CDA1 family)